MNALRNAMYARLDIDGDVLEAELRGATNFNDRSDYAVALMYLGRSGDAVKLLEQLESEKPGEYFVAANLGTAYELAGNNEKALFWIKEGLRRNPSSHEGTEWLHVKILEAKIAQQANPAYFDSHSVLELHPAKIGPRINVDSTAYTPAELIKAIQHQLTERLKFVKPPDPAVAGLLFDYAAIEAATGSMQSAKYVLHLATRYGCPEVKVHALIEDFDRRLFWVDIKRYCPYLLVAVGILYVLYKRGIFVLSRKDLTPGRAQVALY